MEYTHEDYMRRRQEVIAAGIAPMLATLCIECGGVYDLIQEDGSVVTPDWENVKKCEHGYSINSAESRAAHGREDRLFHPRGLARAD